MRILHVINSLHSGGAQAVLADLVTHWLGAEDSQMVVSLLPGGAVSERIRGAGIRVESLDFGRNAITAATIVRLCRLIRAYKPDIVQTWLYHTSLIGSLATRSVSRAPVVWGIHHTLAGQQSLRMRTWNTVRVLAVLSSHLPSAIVCCSPSARRSHEGHGFSESKLLVIENGIDTDYFRPDAMAGASVREELGLGAGTVMIGMFARFHAQKDHANMITAAALVSDSRNDLRFVLAGDGMSPDNDWLRARLQDLGVDQAFCLLGPREDMRRLYPAMNVVTLSSAHGEALPRAIAEAMSCGVPCAATDVGDTAALIGDSGIVVPPAQPGRLAEAWRRLLALPDVERAGLGLAARRRIVESYSLDAMLEGYRGLYQKLVVEQ